ncbi:MAG TPA: ABC transporter ATP-binding protein [Gemmatimonadaceae bacterium]|jgi:lipoprotein-releasing system ATP-binding protein
MSASQVLALADSPIATPMLEATGVVKVFHGGDGAEVRVLEGVDLAVTRGEMVAIIGGSGAGKSTLLHVLGALERPTAGDVRLNGERVADLDDDALAVLRNRSVGFVFQFHHLLKEFSALENVMMPMRIAGRSVPESRDRARSLLVRVGLEHRLHHRPAEMSGGEQQRTAVARALSVEPPLLLADEPSGNLDHDNAESLHDLFTELAGELAIGLVMVTHNRSLARRAGRVLLLERGHLRDNSGNEGAV